MKGLAQRTRNEAPRCRALEETTAMLPSRRSLGLVFVSGVLCCALTCLADDGLVSPQVAAQHALEAFSSSAALYSEALSTETFTVYRPDTKATRHAEQVVLAPRDYLVMVSGRIGRQTLDALGAAAIVYDEGLVGQIRCGLDGAPWHVKAFTRPVHGFGRIGLSEAEAREKAEEAAARSVGSGNLVETSRFVFFWEFADTRERHYIDAQSGHYFTEWDMCLRLAPDLAIKREPVEFESPLYLLEDGKEVPIQMCRDKIGIIFGASLNDAQCQGLVSAYPSVATFERVVFPPAHTPWPDVWLLTFEDELAEDDVQRIALELWQQDSVRVACPVFKKIGYCGEVFEFIFTHAMHVTGHPDSGPALDTMLTQNDKADIASKRQHAPHYPVRYTIRFRKGALTASELVRLSNEYYSASETKFAAISKLVIFRPEWEDYSY